MLVLILFRSLTYAQKGKRALERGGVYASLIKAPLAVQSGGCAYALRLPGKKLERALALLQANGVDYKKVFEEDENGEYREIVP